SAPLQASELLRASCAARFSGGKTSSLVLGGRDGLPLQPGDLLPSPLNVDLATAADTPSTGDKVTSQEWPTRFSLVGPQDRVVNRYSLLTNSICSLKGATEESYRNLCAPISPFPSRRNS